MTVQDFFALLIQYRLLVLLFILSAPWIALGICIVVPGDREEPFVLSLNLGMAIASLFMAIGYIWFATSNGGWGRVFQEADIFLMLAPCYYVGVSFWVTRQRLPLSQVPVFRAIQGLALIGVGYLGVAWFFRKIRILVFSYIPFQYLLLLIFGLIGVMYLGYMRMMGLDQTPRGSTTSHSSSSRSPGRDRQHPSSNHSIDDELEALRRELENDGL